jgi:hypothetical protein
MSKATRYLEASLPPLASAGCQIGDSVFEDGGWSRSVGADRDAGYKIRSIRLNAFLQSGSDQTSLPNRMTPVGGAPQQLHRPHQK